MLNIDTYVFTHDFKDIDCIESDVKTFIKNCRYKLIGTKSFIHDGKVYTVVIYTSLCKKIVKIN